MSLHLKESIYVAYSPFVDPKWKPEFLQLRKFYFCYAYENGSIKLKDGGTSEAVYFHVAGENGRPCRLISSNVIVIEADEYRNYASETDLWKKIESSAGIGAASDKPPF